MKKWKVAIASIAVLGGCASGLSANIDMPISTGISAMQFNSVASQYMRRPTFVSVQHYPSGEEVMTIERDDYGVRDKYGAEATSRIWFDRSGAKVIADATNKYFEWETQASEAGDIFAKDIAKTKSIKGGAVQVGFASGSGSQHYLTLEFCALGACLADSALFFDRAGAEALKEVLTDFAEGKIKAENVSSKYN
ncbi:hypothetical protein ACFQDM_06955 [Ponticaulis profundi]|uniref:Lipoprotein n=2 Tax=Ponticaulis profundi TaxID=2665222 RepID=A0ABW1S9F5_9PROT